MLRGLGLDLACGLDVRHQRQVDVTGVVGAQLHAHLPYGLEERQRLDVAHRSPDLDDGDFGLTSPAGDARLDFVGDVGNDLHRASEIVAAALLPDHRLVDLAGGEVVRFVHARRLEAFVMTEIEIGLGPVFGNEHLSVLERAHRAGVDVDVRVELEEGDADAARFENRGERGGGYPLPQRGNHAARHEHILGHQEPRGWDGEWYTKCFSGSILRGPSTLK